MENIKLGELLISYGYISEKDLNKALQSQKENGNKRRIGDELVALKLVSEKQVLQALAQRLSLKVLSFNTQPVNINAVKLLPKSLAVKYNIICVNIIDGKLLIATSDPLNYYALEDVKQIVNYPVEIALCEKSDIAKQIEYNYAEIEAKAVTSYSSSSQEQVQIRKIEENEPSEESAVVKIINTLLIKGYTANASDIHIEPFSDKTKIRIRTDGMLVDYINLDRAMHHSIVARIKILSELDIAEKRLPQDGHFKDTIEGIMINIRTSIIPTLYGEKVVLRYLNSDLKLDNHDTFGMNEENYQTFSNMLANPNGLIYITGPTGSGKTTTLYAAIESLSKGAVNISTIEDPVEKDLPNVNQMQVNILAGITFEQGLRALLRQDPDVLMVGETRDELTAQTSVRASITGHLVLSTLHTNDAVSSIERLRDMGVEPYLLASSLVGIVAQRLVKKVCQNCKKEYYPTAEELEILEVNPIKLYRGSGCHLCNNTGYKGRMSVHEIVVIDKKIKHLISSKANIEEIYEYVFKVQKVKTLQDSMRELVVKGITTVEEMKKLMNYIG